MSLREVPWQWPAMRSAAVFLLVTLGACATTKGTGPAGEVMTPEHVARLRSVAFARISPDGRLIAYGLRVPRRPFVDEDGPAWIELHVVDREGKSRPFITGPVDIGSVDWTPDGSGLSFLAKRGKDEFKSLYIIPIDGGEARRAVAADADISGYAWSPDGKRVAFLATEKFPKDRKERKDKGFAQEVFEEDWQAVKVWIAEAWNEKAKPRLLDLPGSASEVRWSPVGDTLALALAPTPLVDDSYMKRRIHVVSVGPGEVLKRIDNLGKLGAIEWSPDGRHLAFISAADLHDPSAGRLCVANVENGNYTDVVPDYAGEISSIAWQDADTVMFLGDEGVWTTLGEVRRDGTGRKTHLPAGREVLSGLNLSRNGQSAAMMLESPRHPMEVALMNHGDSGPKRLTDSNPWLSEVRFGVQEVVTWKARDGLSLEGLLIKPVGTESLDTEKHPLILHVHGGPEAHDRNGWLTGPSSPGQVAAGSGYYVFYPNYRGSTGRGVHFSKMGQADFAGREFDDLVDAVDHLVEQFPISPRHVGITGGSYGGYATAWCCTYYSDRFAVGVMNVGLADQISMMGTSDIPEEWYLVHSRKRLWDDWKFFLERSPIYHVKRSRTPLLILHGKDDPRVDRGQSLELFRHLKTLNQAPVRLVLYPGEGHGNRKAAARYDYNIRMMQWFDHYLKGEGGAAPDYQPAYPLEETEKNSERP